MTPVEALSNALKDTTPHPADVHHFVADWRTNSDKAVDIVKALADNGWTLVQHDVWSPTPPEDDPASDPQPPDTRNAEE